MTMHYLPSFLILLLCASCVPQAAAVPSDRTTIAARAVAAAPPVSRAEAAAVRERIRLIDPAALAPGPAARPFLADTGSDWNLRRSLECLTSAVYHEARSESEDGQRAVAQVVLNRVRHAAFPDSVCGVVYQGSHRRTGCQFTFTCDGSLGRRPEPAAWARARKVAEDALSGTVFGTVGLATHYHTSAVRPWWAPRLKRAVQVGSHIFYRWHGRWGDPLAFRQNYAAMEPGTSAPPNIAAAVDARISRTEVDGIAVVVHRGGPQKVTAGADGAIVRIHRASPSPSPVTLAALDAGGEGGAAVAATEQLLTN